MSAIVPELCSMFPRLVGTIPWLSLGSWPTPVQRLGDLGRRAGVELWIKRDDRAGGRYGGNKVRKLEPLLAGAVEAGARAVLTVGGIGSNHTVATAAYADGLGLDTHAVVFPQPVTPQVRRALETLVGLGAQLHPCPSRLHVPLAMAMVKARQRGLHVVGPGGSSPTGTLGFVAGALELAAQIRRGELPEPDAIVVALGSGGTMAGLALGCALAGLKTRVLGVRVVERALANRPTVHLLIRRTRALLKPRPKEPVNLLITNGYLGRCYGDPTEASLAAVTEARDREGLALEPTYTGKALAALLEQGPSMGKRLLFWNTYNSRDTLELSSDRATRVLPQEVCRWLSPLAPKFR